MPYKNPADKKRWTMLNNPNRVASRQAGTNGKSKRLNLKDKSRTYVCELCGKIGRTAFHEYNGNPTDVIEVCDDNTVLCCHFRLHNELFTEDDLFVELD